jgi:hypothetical protein
MIPASRLTAKNEKIQQLEAALAEKDAAHQTTQTEYAQHRTTAAEEAAMLRAGVTNPEDMALIRFRHSRAPEAERPAFLDYVAGTARTDPYLSSLFGTAPVDGTPPAPGTPAPPPPVVPPATGGVNAGVTPAPTPGVTRTIKWFQALSDAEKDAIPKAERAAGLAGGWPLG